MPSQPNRASQEKVPKTELDVLAEALRRRSEKDGPRSLSLGESDSENNRRIMADLIRRGAALWPEAGWKASLYEEMSGQVPAFSWRDFEEAFDLIVSPTYRDFFLFFAEEGPMPDELWEARREPSEERSTRISIEKLLGATQKEFTEEEVLEILDTKLSAFFELVGYDEETGEVEVRMQSAMREGVGSAFAEELGVRASSEDVEGKSSSGASLDLDVSLDVEDVLEDASPEEGFSEGDLPEMDFEAAGAYAKQLGATAVLGLLSELRDAAAEDPTPDQEQKQQKILQALAYPVRRRLFGKPSTLEMSQDPPHEQAGDEKAFGAAQRYERALKQLGAPRPRYYAQQLVKEYPERTIADSEPHPTRSGLVLTLSGEEAPKVTVLGES